MPFLVRSMLAGAVRPAGDAVRVLVPAVGRRLRPQGAPVRRGGDPAASCRSLTGAPVKWVEDRYENLAASGHSKEVVCTLELAVGGATVTFSASADGSSATAAPTRAIRGRA